MKGFFKKTLESLGISPPQEAADMVGTVFVTSGTNAVGYRVASGLLDAGYPHVRIGVWKGARQPGVDPEIGQRVALELEQRGATVIKFDWTDPEGYEMALAGVKSVFCTLPHMEAKAEAFSAFVQACKTAGVEHFVKTSFYSVLDRGITYEGILPYAQFQHACDRELTKPPAGHKIGDLKLPPPVGSKELTMSFTLLRTSHLMSTPLIYQGPVMRDNGKYVTASYAMGVNYVSPNDVAKAAIVTLVDRKTHKNKVYNLTGAGPIKDADLCKFMSEHFYGKDLEYVTVGYHEMQEQLRDERNLDDWLVQDLATAEKIKASGVEEKDAAYFNDLETILGTKPESCEDYLKAKDAMTYQEFPEKPTPPIKKPAAPPAEVPVEPTGDDEPPPSVTEGGEREGFEAGRASL